MQIYNEKVFDLLNEHQSYKGKGLRIRWSKQEQFTVENLFVFECENEQQVLELYKYGVSNKIISSHNLNNASSRSHVIFTI